METLRKLYLKDHHLPKLYNEYKRRLSSNLSQRDQQVASFFWVPQKSCHEYKPIFVRYHTLFTANSSIATQLTTFPKTVVLWDHQYKTFSALKNCGWLLHACSFDISASGFRVSPKDSTYLKRNIYRHFSKTLSFRIISITAFGALKSCGQDIVFRLVFQNKFLRIIKKLVTCLDD